MNTAANYKFSNYSRGGFTLIEALTALVIVGFICGTVLVVINDSVDSIADQSSRLEAIEVARENMEAMTSQSVLQESVETGMSDIYPDIEWTKSVEVVEFPGGSRMWMKAVSSANFYNSANELEEVKFENWLAPLTEQQQKLVLKDRQSEQQYLSELEAEQAAEEEELMEDEQEQTEKQDGQQPDTNVKSPSDIVIPNKVTGGEK